MRRVHTITTNAPMRGRRSGTQAAADDSIEHCFRGDHPWIPTSDAPPLEKPCWQAQQNILYKYKDTDLTPDGVRSIVLKAGGDAKASIVVKGKGVNVDMPLLGSAIVSLVTAQLRSSSGVCWEGVYTVPFINYTSLVLSVRSARSQLQGPVES